MRGVALCEALFVRLTCVWRCARRSGGWWLDCWPWSRRKSCRPVMARCIFPAFSHYRYGPWHCFFVLKIIASIVSIGSGFRGGLFFSSLLVGALGGHLLAVALATVWPDGHFDSNAYAVISMSGLSAAVIGGPLTMTFIALETTGDLWLTTAVLIAVIISSQVTRELFRLLVRDLAVPFARRDHPQRGRYRVVRDLTVGKMMRRDVRTVPVTASVRLIPRALPIGSSATGWRSTTVAATRQGAESRTCMARKPRWIIHKELCAQY